MVLMPIPRTPRAGPFRGSADDEVGGAASTSPIIISSQEIDALFDLLGVRGDAINNREFAATTTSVPTEPAARGLVRCPAFENLAAFLDEDDTKLTNLFKRQHIGCLCNNLSVHQRQFPKVDLI